MQQPEPPFYNYLEKEYQNNFDNKLKKAANYIVSQANKREGNKSLSFIWVKEEKVVKIGGNDNTDIELERSFSSFMQQETGLDICSHFIDELKKFYDEKPHIANSIDIGQLVLLNNQTPVLHHKKHSLLPAAIDNEYNKYTREKKVQRINKTLSNYSINKAQEKSSDIKRKFELGDVVYVQPDKFKMKKIITQEGGGQRGGDGGEEKMQKINSQLKQSDFTGTTLEAIQEIIENYKNDFKSSDLNNEVEIKLSGDNGATIHIPIDKFKSIYAFMMDIGYFIFSTNNIKNKESILEIIEPFVNPKTVEQYNEKAGKGQTINREKFIENLEESFNKFKGENSLSKEEAEAALNEVLNTLDSIENTNDKEMYIAKLKSLNSFIDDKIQEGIKKEIKQIIEKKIKEANECCDDEAAAAAAAGDVAGDVPGAGGGAETAAAAAAEAGGVTETATEDKTGGVPGDVPGGVPGDVPGAEAAGAAAAAAAAAAGGVPKPAAGNVTGAEGETEAQAGDAAKDDDLPEPQAGNAGKPGDETGDNSPKDRAGVKVETYNVFECFTPEKNDVVRKVFGYDDDKNTPIGFGIYDEDIDDTLSSSIGERIKEALSDDSDKQIPLEILNYPKKFNPNKQLHVFNKTEMIVMVGTKTLDEEDVTLDSDKKIYGRCIIDDNKIKVFLSFEEKNVLETISINDTPGEKKEGNSNSYVQYLHSREMLTELKEKDVRNKSLKYKSRSAESYENMQFFSIRKDGDTVKATPIVLAYFQPFWDKDADAGATADADAEATADADAGATADTEANETEEVKATQAAAKKRAEKQYIQRVTKNADMYDYLNNDNENDAYFEVNFQNNDAPFTLNQFEEDQEEKNMMAAKYIPNTRIVMDDYLSKIEDATNNYENAITKLKEIQGKLLELEGLEVIDNVTPQAGDLKLFVKARIMEKHPGNVFGRIDEYTVNILEKPKEGHEFFDGNSPIQKIQRDKILEQLPGYVIYMKSDNNKEYPQYIKASEIKQSASSGGGKKKVPEKKKKSPEKKKKSRNKRTRNKKMHNKKTRTTRKHKK